MFCGLLRIYDEMNCRRRQIFIFWKVSYQMESLKIIQRLKFSLNSPKLFFCFFDFSGNLSSTCWLFLRLSSHFCLLFALLSRKNDCAKWKSKFVFKKIYIKIIIMSLRQFVTNLQISQKNQKYLLCSSWRSSM